MFFFGRLHHLNKSLCSFLFLNFIFNLFLLLSLYLLISISLVCSDRSLLHLIAMTLRICYHAHFCVAYFAFKIESIYLQTQIGLPLYGLFTHGYFSSRLKKIATRVATDRKRKHHSYTVLFILRLSNFL